MNSSQASAKKAELFRRGNIRWMLNPLQRRMFEFLDSRKSRHLVVHVHRGGGKSYGGVLRGTEVNLLRTASNVKYFGPSEKMVRKISLPIMRSILRHADEEDRPKWNAKDSLYEWKNLSTIGLAPADGGHADSERGTDTHLAILDEAGFMADPDYVVNEVVMPRAIPVDGQILWLSTSPRSPSHPFANKVREAQKDGNYIALRARNNPKITPEMYQAFVDEAGGEETTRFRREYDCDLVKDEEFAVLPGLMAAVGREHVPTRVVTAGYVDFNAVSHFIVFEGTSDGGFVAAAELAVRADTGIEDTIIALRQQERRVGGLDITRVFVGPKIKEIYQRLASQYDFPGHVPEKYSPQSGSVLLRTMKEGNSIRISNACTKTLRHLNDATWNETRTKFDNSGDGGFFEGVQAAAALASVFASSSTDDFSGIADIYGGKKLDDQFTDLLATALRGGT